MRPGYVAAVFEDRDSRIWLAPYELHESYLSDASCIDQTQLNEFLANGTIQKIDFPRRSARPRPLAGSGWQGPLPAFHQSRAGIAVDPSRAN
jgi:hypothetical protein